MLLHKLIALKIQDLTICSVANVHSRLEGKHKCAYFNEELMKYWFQYNGLSAMPGSCGETNLKTAYLYFSHVSPDRFGIKQTLPGNLIGFCNSMLTASVSPQMNCLSMHTDF